MRGCVGECVGVCECLSECWGEFDGEAIAELEGEGDASTKVRGVTTALR